MNNNKIENKDIIDNVLLNVNRLKHLNNLTNDITNDIATREGYIAEQLFALSYSISELIKKINNDLDIVYKNLNNDKK